SSSGSSSGSGSGSSSSSASGSGSGSSSSSASGSGSSSSSSDSASGDTAKGLHDKNILKTDVRNYELIKSNIIEIEELSYDMVKSLMIPFFIENEEICKCIYNIVGGNTELIKVICKGLHKLNNELNKNITILKNIEKDNKEKNITYDMDEIDEKFKEICENKTPVEKIIYFKKLEKQKQFLKNIHENILNSFILDFEKKIIKFFSLPIIEQMKLIEDPKQNETGTRHIIDKQKYDNGNSKIKKLTYIEFLVTIFEVIRYFLKKKKVFCKNILNLNNPILLGLIDVNIIHYNYANKYLELSVTFYEILLLNYINFKYKQLPMKHKAQYNINYVLNYNIIKHEYNLLETQA
ncbi:conserved protein, unknown function, partial [Hepatocystis sp. ex Piliocolobus tephrosceles]